MPPVTAWGRWARVLFLLVALLVWPWVVLAPRVRWARRAAAWGARLWVRGSATPLRVQGLEHLTGLRLPCVLVANHGSKLDAVVLLAALPLSFAFVAKSELAAHFWLRWPLRRVRVLFVRRGGPPRSPSDTERATDMLRAGDSLLFFPEGTVGEQPGLLPFHHGAFVAAACAGVPVVPIAMRGTRAVLPDPDRPPTRGPIDIEVGAPIEGERGEDPAASAPALLSRARAFVAARCGDPDLAPASTP